MRLYDRFSPRSLGVASFILIAIGLVVVALTVGNDWSTVAVILGLLLVGICEGTLLTLLFNVLVSASPKRLAGDVGVFLASGFSRSGLPHELETRAVSGGVDFVTNHELRSVLGATSATPGQVEKAVAINEDARLRALRASFLIVGRSRC